MPEIRRVIVSDNATDSLPVKGEAAQTCRLLDGKLHPVIYREDELQEKIPEHCRLIHALIQDGVWRQATFEEGIRSVIQKYRRRSLEASLEKDRRIAF